MSLVEQPDISDVILDFEHLERLDSSGIAVLSLGVEAFQKGDKRLRITNINASHQKALAMMPVKLQSAMDTQDESTFFERVGQWGYVRYGTITGYLQLCRKALLACMVAFLPGRRPPKDSVAEQCVAIGVNALPIVALLSLLLGLIMAFQAAYQLQQFGANIFVANLVGISMAREFGPMMTGIILAGRSGSAIAAELGTMMVQEEIDALHTMGIEPMRFLIVPRLLAIFIVGPALTIMSDLIGIFGGFVIGTLYLDLSMTSYVEQTLIAVKMFDFGTGLLKSVVYAWLIGTIGCFCGLRIEGGASGVGRATTKAVVMSIFMIIVADSLFATIITLSR